jgi:predicted acylesterase/phospholipase RssA
MSFKLGINMAGAVSAGAYTAGVLDFLTEALDEWYKAKDAGLAVPTHEVSIEVFSGASAGGMCAAIAACLTQDEFEHIEDTSRQGTTNKFYEAWVNRIDIRELLKTDDLKSVSQIPSLLDSTIIEEIANYALDPGAPKTRKYVSQHLTLFLTLTNLRGVPYALFEDPSLAPDEYVTYHADRLRFEMVDPGEVPKAQDALPLPRRKADDKIWPLLRTTAMATGAFPAFLAPRVLDRAVADYTPPLWTSICQCGTANPPVAPAWPPGQTASWTTVNVDGGVTNNSPFTLAHDYLATLDPPSHDCQNERDPQLANRAVLTIAPFPGNAAWNSGYDALKASTLFSVLPSLFSALLAQSRFFGESLAIVTGGATSSRFFIAPSDDRNPDKPALQCGLLGAFGGFFDRGFRAHDFQLGRRNCQAFLDKHFVLPVDNPLFAGLQELDQGARKEIVSIFGRKTPVFGGVLKDQPWLSIIPLCGTARKAVSYPDPAKINDESLDEIVELISSRVKALLPLILVNLKSGVLRFFIKWGAGALITVFGGKREIKNYLIRTLGDNVEK